MEIFNVIQDVGDLNTTPYRDCLLRVIPMEFYYILDLETVEIDGVKKCNVSIRKREGNPMDIPKRIRLYDQPSKSKIGISLSTYSIDNTDSLIELLKTMAETFDLKKLHKLLEYELLYINSQEEFEERYKLPFRGFFTVAIDGVLLIDTIPNYDDKVLSLLYKDALVTSSDDKICSLCFTTTADVYFSGSIKEPGVKLISTTRVNEYNPKSVFIRCKDCEERLIKGFNLMDNIAVKGKRNKKQLDSVLIPLFMDVNLFNQMKKLRKEVDSDLKYYEALERLFDRFSRRGLTTILEIVFQRNLKNVNIIRIDTIPLSNLKRLHYKKKFDSFLESNGFLNEEDDLPYYPNALLNSPIDLKWKAIEQVKQYWLGLYPSTVWNRVHLLFNISKRDYARYSLFESYLEYGNDLIHIIKNDKYYLIGRLIKEIIYWESRCSNTNEDKIIKRFRLYNKNYDYLLFESSKLAHYYLDSYKTHFKEIVPLDRYSYLQSLINQLASKEVVYNNESVFYLGRFERYIDTE